MRNLFQYLLLPEVPDCYFQVTPTVVGLSLAKPLWHYLQLPFLAKASHPPFIRV